MSNQLVTTNNIVAYLKKYFNVVAVIDLFHYDYCPVALYEVLLNLKKDKFDTTDRIVFIFNDTDYYYKNQHGFILNNLQKILNKLDIPNYFCIILTHQSYIKNEVLTVSNQDKTPIAVFDIFPDYVFNVIGKIPDIDFNFSNIEKSFIFLSAGRTRKHRVAFFSLLESNHLLDKGQVSLSITPNAYLPDTPTDISNLNNKCDITFLTTMPFTRVNEDWEITNTTINHNYDSFLKTVNENFKFKNFVEPEIKNINFTDQKNFKLFMTKAGQTAQSSFLYIIPETVFSYPGTFITEKSLGGIMGKRPFVMLGPKNNLAKLKDWGFKTFDRWWDESYDNIEDPSERMLAVYNIVEEISKKPVNELIDLAIEMKDVLQFNYNFLAVENNFSKINFERLQQQCVENLKIR